MDKNVDMVDIKINNKISIMKENGRMIKNKVKDIINFKVIFIMEYFKIILNKDLVFNNLKMVIDI